MPDSDKDPVWFQVWEELHGVCCICYAPASSVHEIVPRSAIGDKALQDPENRVTLCTPCHTMIHQGNPMEFVELLKSCRALVKGLFS